MSFSHKVLFALTLAISPFIGSPDVQAKASDCLDFAQVSEQEDGSILSLALSRLEGLFVAEEPPDGIEPPQADYPYFVTTRAGVFSGTTCEEGHYEKQELYPIGMVVKMLGHADLPYYEAAGLGKPVHVLTEYGQRKIIAQEDITPITPNAAYIFADGVTRANYCAATDPCPGNQPVECTSAIWKCKLDVGAIQGFAIAPSLRDQVAETLTSYDALTKDPILQMAEGALSEEELARLTVAACRPVPVKAYMPGGTLHQPRSVALSLCASVEKGQLMPFKIVTRDKAEALFARHMTGSFHRRIGGPDTLFSEPVRKLTDKKAQYFVKPCGREISEALTFSFGAGASVKAAFRDIAEVKIGANVKGDLTYKDTIADDDYLLYATYMVRPMPILAVETEEPELWVFDILFRAACKDEVPAEQTSVTIFYKDLPQGYTPISVRQGVFVTYRENWGNEAFAEAKNSAQIYEGYFWLIKDHIGHLYWRDALRDYFYNDLPAVRKVVDRYPLEYRPMVRDFFVYLFLAAAFDQAEPKQF